MNDSNDRLVWVNGEYIKARDAAVSLLSPTAQFGLNVFEGIRGYYCKDIDSTNLFRLEDHLSRLNRSARLLGINLPFSTKEITKSASNIVKQYYHSGDVSLRITAYVGEEGGWMSDGPVGLFIAPILKPRLDINNLEPLDVCISSWDRITDECMPPAIKLGANYINARYATKAAVNSGFDLPLFLNKEGFVTESGGAGFCVVKNKTVYFPAVENSLLDSITRDTLINILPDLGYSVKEQRFGRAFCYAADEMFLFGTSMELRPIKQLDNFYFTSSIMFKDIANAYFDCVSSKRFSRQSWELWV